MRWSALRNRRRTFYRLLVVFVALALAVRYGHTRAAPDLTVPIGVIFPQAATFVEERGVFHVYDDSEALLGWAASGSSSGYGGPMLLVAGIDTLGALAGVAIHRLPYRDDWLVRRTGSPRLSDALSSAALGAALIAIELLFFQ